MNGTVIVTCARSGSTNSGRDAELLDHAEDVVPASGVQPRRVLAQLVEDLVHLERGEDRLDQHGGADRAARDAERVLREHEDVVPEARLEMALQLRQVEVRARAARRAAPARCGRSTARSRRGSPRSARRRRSTCCSSRCQPRGRTTSVAVSSFSAYVLPSGCLERDRAAHGVGQVALAVDDVLPGRRERVLEVGHEDLRARVERVDHHLAVDGPGDLDPAVEEVGRSRRHAPVRTRGRHAFRQEVGEHAGVELGLTLAATLQELEPPSGSARGGAGRRKRAPSAKGLRRRRGRAARPRREPSASAHPNCASSVEPVSASVELSPTACRTASK